jgi:hypothetical protein
VSVVVQGELFEPSPAEVPGLTTSHLAWADKARRQAHAFEARGMETLAAWSRQTAARHDEQADELAMLADLYRLGGLSA